MQGFQPKKIAIIGAGPVGLIFLKVFKSKGHNVVTFEKKSGVGGVWRLNNSATEQEQGSVGCLSLHQNLLLWATHL